MSDRTRALIALWMATGLCLPATAFAHGFGRLYNLPVPFWLYAWGAAAALILSFLLVAWFATVRTATETGQGSGSDFPGWFRRLLPLLKCISVLVLLLCIATALLGTRDPYRNFSMICFWVVFVLGVTYLTALVGNFYALVNPWRALCDGLGRIWHAYPQGRFRYPAWLGDWPALTLYLGFISYELFVAGKPFSLGIALLGYTALNLAGVWLVGARAWFRHCEFFAVFLRLVGLMAPIGGTASGVVWRQPFSGLIQTRPGSMALLVFALAMLSTTAFDGLRATQWWVSLFWNDPYGLVRNLVGDRPMLVLAEALPWYRLWELLCLIASPFLYLFAYLLCMALAKLLTRSERSVRTLALDFGYSLLPIALVYHLTHYATLLLSDGMKILSAVSDPFGWGWNLFSTAWKFRAPILPDMGIVWHAQVGLILFGHVVSVIVAHRIALRVFPTRGQALLSQLPLLLLMVTFTIGGLWILAQPLTVERMT